MLIEVGYKEGDTVSMKLTSGEEIIARLEKEDGDTYTVSRPMMLAATQQGLGLAPFMFSASPDAKIKLNNKNVLCVVKSVDDMAKQYIQGTTGITV